MASSLGSFLSLSCSSNCSQQHRRRLFECRSCFENSPSCHRTNSAVKLDTSRRNVLLTAATAGAILLSCHPSAPAFIETGDEEELVEKVEEDCKETIETQGEINSFKEETAFLPTAIYQLSKAGRALDGDDFQGTSKVLGAASTEGWIANVEKALSKHKKWEGLIHMEETHKHTSTCTASAAMSGSLLEQLNCKEAVQQTEGKKELTRTTNVSNVCTRSAPSIEGKTAIGMMIKGSSSLTKIMPSISDEEKELLRRKRISQANKGKVPWNKGGKHSAETIRRIRAGVVERMKDPKIREKLRLQAEASNLRPETKMKIKIGIRRAWAAKKQLRVRQEICLLEWAALIAESARRGYDGDVEHQWNSYSMLRLEGLKSLASLKPKKLPISRPDSLSAEHRLHISAAIKQKWSNPAYRVNVEEGIRKSWFERKVTSPARPKANSYKKTLRPPKKTITGNNSRASEDLVTRTSSAKISPKGNTSRPDSLSSRDLKKLYKAGEVAEIMEQDSSKLSSDVASYKDPEAEKKLQKLKSIRARRMHMEAQKHKEITERARALIAQAQEAARALEAAAVQDKNALAPLLETRKLLAEAVFSLESLNKKSFASDYMIKEGDAALYAQVSSLANVSSLPLLMVNNGWDLGSSSVDSSGLNM